MPGGDHDWANAANWNNSNKPGVPGAADVAQLIDGATVTLTGEVTVGAVHMASLGTAQLTIDGGKLIATLEADYNSVGYAGPGSLIIQNGGSVIYYGHVIVGLKDAEGGAVVVRDGTMRVANSYCHNEGYFGKELRNTRTTLYPGGLLDVVNLVPNSGVVDVAGGTLIIRRNVIQKVEEWVASGRIIAMGGDQAWKIKTVFDTRNDCTIVIAVPTDPSKPKPEPLPVPEPLPPPPEPPPAPEPPPVPVVPPQPIIVG